MIHDVYLRVPPTRPDRIDDALPKPDARGVEWALGGVGCLIVLLTPLAVLALPQSDVVAVVGTPGGGAADSIRIIANAGGTVLNRGGPDNVLLAHSDQAGFAGRLYAAGARLVIDGRLSDGCSPSTTSTSSPTAVTATARNPTR